MTTLDVFRLDELHQVEAQIRRAARFTAREAAGGTGTIYQQAERFRRQLDRLERGAAREVLDAWSQVRGSVDDEIRRLTRLLDADPDDAAALARAVDRLRQSRDRLVATVGRYAEQVGEVVVARQGRAAEAAQNANSALVAAQLPAGAAGIRRLDAGQVEQLLGQLRSGAFARTMSNMAPEFADKLRQHLVDGIALGRSPRDVARRIGTSANVPRWRGLTIARTETLRAYREVSRRQMERNSDTVAGWTWLSQADIDTCAFCWSMHGQHFNASEQMATHPNCLPAGAVVAGPRVVGTTARWYEGELIDLQTAGGRNLTVTPNHPVLTGRGWIAAKDLREGDDLICGSLGDADAIDAGPDDGQRPALIEQVVESFGRSRGVSARAMPTAAEDFHGDGEGSEVHVVRTHRLLGSDVEPSCAEHGRQANLVLGSMQATLLTSLSGAALLLPGSRPSAHGFVSRLHLLASLLRRERRHSSPVCVGRSAKVDAGVGESTHHGRSGHTDAASNGVGRFPRLVAGDEIPHVEVKRFGARQPGSADGLRGAPVAPEVSVNEDLSQTLLGYAVPSRSVLARHAGRIVTDCLVNRGVRRWSGHVYNLETADGWFLANGIVTHNCKCSQAPRTRSWSELGFDGIEDQPELQVANGRELFDRQPARVQRAVLGPAKFQAYADGQISLADLVGFRHDPDWGRVGFERSLRDLAGV